jgi:hypothetical protein
MFDRRVMRLSAVCLAVASAGCSSLKEIPRADYLARSDRRDVRVVTRDGLEYEFDYAHVQADSLVGYRSRDVEGAFEDFAVLHIPFEDITRLSARRVDWRRTLLVGGGVVVTGVAAGLATAAASNTSKRESGGGKTPIP